MSRNKFIEDFRTLNRLLKEGSVFTVIDTETTGLHSASDHILEIGAVKFDKTGILDTYNQLINPEIKISETVIQLCHINDEMVKDCPVIKDVLPEFISFLDKSIIIAHNATFDINFINEELNRCKKKPLSNPIIDTLALTRWAYPKLGKYNQPFLAAAFNIEIKNAHRAEDDARVCREIFLRAISDTLSIQKD